MDNNNKHIDNLIREKFDAFSPTPPTHIWAGIEKEISNKPYSYFSGNKRAITVSAIILLAFITSIILFEPFLTGTSDNEFQQNTEIENIVSSSDNEEVMIETELISNNSNQKNSISDPDNSKTENLIVSGEQTTENTILNSDESNIEQPKVIDESNSNSGIVHSNSYPKLSIIKLKQSALAQPKINSNIYYSEQQGYPSSTQEVLLSLETNNINNSHWKIGYFITPEVSISDFDSVQILNSYTLSIEPTYFFSKNWFARFGAGFSFVRDRGFAQITYLTNDYMGSYDDVYDITFDTISGNITPIYHTKTIEVWDSVRHISVSEVTNKYLYLQIPALFGYYHNKPGSDISWYVMGGPAFNLRIGSWVDNPKPDAKDADIIDLQNNLPVRSNNYFQLWLGAGIEYEVNKKLSIAIEPGYRYYFKSIYKSPYNATSSSGVSLRVGLVYIIK